MNSTKLTGNHEKFGQNFAALANNCLIFENYERILENKYEAFEGKLIFNLPHQTNISHFSTTLFRIRGYSTLPLHAPLEY